MSEKNLTVWQRLSQAFGPNALLNQDYPTFHFDKKELLRTQDKGEYEREKLQAQQTFYLSNQWAKIDRLTVTNVTNCRNPLGSPEVKPFGLNSYPPRWAKTPRLFNIHI